MTVCTKQYDRNKELLALAQGGDKSAADALVEANMGLVRSIAVRFRDRGVEFDDLLQIGAIGLLRAVGSFDLDRGTAFSTYAVPLIIGEIRRFLRDDGLIKVSRQQKRLGAELLRARERFAAENERDPTISELAEVVGITVEEAAVAIDASAPVHSLSETIGGDDSFTLEETLSEGTGVLDRSVERIALAEALSRLPPLWQKIILLRYYRDLSQQKTAEHLGLSQVKISREEKKIFEALRKELG